METALKAKLTLEALDSGNRGSASSLVNEYNAKLRSTIAMSQLRAKEVKGDEYHKSYPILAFNVLSCSPFAGLPHVKVALRCNESDLMSWSSDYPEFAKAVEQGFLEGELLARELLLRIAFEPSSKVNTHILKILSNNVYEIKDDHQVTLTTSEDMNWKVEVIKPKQIEEVKT